MEKIKKPVIFLIILIVILKPSIQIYIPEHEQYQKPVTYTSGIKTSSYRRPSEIDYHHNYSKVYHQNGYSSSNSYDDDESSTHVFPIYNGHTYGARPSTNERLTVYVINGTRIRKNENPTRQIAIYNKEKRSPKVEAYRVCPRNATGQFVYESSCNQFLNCWKGRGYVQNCSPGTLFNPKTSECDFPEKVQCITGPRLSILQREKSAKFVKQIGCPNEFSGLIPNYTDCSKFINCVNGIENFMDCPSGTLFDMDKNICDFAHKAHCFNGQNEKFKQQNIDGRLDFENFRHKGAQRERLRYRDNEIRCPDDADGLHKHPTDCTKFLNCAHGRTFVQDCAPGTLFNPLIKICDFPYNVRCEYQGGSSGYHHQQHRGDRFTTQSHYVPGIYESSTNQYDDYHNNRYNKGTDIYSTSSTYGGNNDHHYNKGSSGTYYQGSHGETGTNYGINRGSVDVYQRGESGVYGVGNRSTGIYRQGETPYGTNSYGENQNNNWRQTSQDPQTSSYGNHYNNFERDQYDRSITSTNLHQGSTRDGYGTGQNYNHNRHQSGNYNNRQDMIYNRQDAIYNNRQDTSVNGQPFKNDPYSVNSYPNQYNRGSVGSQTSTYGYGSQYDKGTFNRDNWGREQYHKGSNTYHQTTYGQTYWGEDPYNQRGSTYDTRPNQNVNGNHYQNNNGLGYGQRGETGYVERADNHNNQYGGGYNRFSKGYHQPQTNNRQEWYDQNQFQHNRNNLEDESITPNYNQVVNVNHFRKTTVVPIRQPYEPFFGTTPKQHSESNDYDDLFGASSTKYLVTTPRIVEKNWPPPFPSTDVNADYVFEYEDGENVSLEAENSVKNHQNGSCGKSDFPCSTDSCISKTLVCNGVRDCPHGNDELKCLEYVAKFSVNKNHKLAILEKQRWDNVTIATCALLCIEARRFQCRSFNYRKIDKTCFLSDNNEAMTGGLISYYPFDYYELTSEKIDCSSKYVCHNKKCINRDQICDGNDDCGDRMDEKGCKPENFDYSLKLTGSKRKNEGQIEVTAFGKTGFVCDDKFSLVDANVVCKELGFGLGAAEVKGNSFYANESMPKKPFYMMDDVTCTGNETRLMDCDFSGWGVHNCLGQEVAGVVCKTPQEKCSEGYWQCDTGRECLPLAFVCDGLLDCMDGSDEKPYHCDSPTQIRLVNGTSRQQGRIEIRHHGTWGTICDDDFNEDAAKVVCRSLGYKGSATVKKDGYFGPGNGPIWLDQVFCSGNETTIENCTHWDWGEHNCEHSEDVGVVCSNIYQLERHSSMLPPQTPQTYPNECGYRNDNIFNRDNGVHFRVVQGSIARKGDYPWQAAIRVKGKTKAAHWCGAVVISEKFVLTAAHCLFGYPKGAYIVIAGDYNIDENEGTEQEAYIEDFYIHKDFRQGHKMNNDIALVKLKGRGFRLNNEVQAICLPEKTANYEAEDLNCTISGFGSIESGKSAFSHNLRAGWIPIQKRQICTMPHVYGDALTEGMICAGSLDEGIDSCDGDSGGPLACLHNGVFTLYGITSWGQHCGYANKPGVYVKVAHYRKWIDDNFYKHSSS